MADNVDLPASGVKAATDKVTYSSDTADVQLVRPVHVAGAEGARTVTGLTNDDGSMNTTIAGASLTSLPVTIVDSGGDAIGDATNGIDVDVTRLPALVAGSANIGDVDVLTLPADPLGANADALVAAGATGSISAKLRRISQSIEDLKTTAIVAGTANIGDVDVLTLPALVASTANIGDVDVLTLPNVSTATLSNVADSASTGQLLASNASRKGCVIWNDSTEDLFIKYGTTASLTDCVYKIPADATWTMIAPYYTGRIDGIWRNNASGSARITEL